MIPASHFNSIAHAAAPLAVSGLWQGLAVALALALCLRVSPRISAAHRFVVWSAGFLAIAASSLLPLVLRGIGPSTTSAFAASATASSHAWLHLDARWTYVIAALWLVASVARGADLIFHVIRLHHLWHTATPIEVPAFPPSQRAFQVCTTPSFDRPSVIGFFAPRVLIPAWLLPRLTSGELNQIVLHESTHLARRDDWTNLLQKLCLVLFPLNPALWAIDRQLGKEREMACDEAVVRITQAPRAYAACLTGLAERGLAYRKEALSLGAWQRRSELVRRVHRILADRRSLPPVTARLLLVVFGCSLLVATVELARCPKLVAFVPALPSRAQSDASAESGDVVYPTNPKHATLTEGAHLVQARAEMPWASIAKPSPHRARVRTHAEGELRAASSEPDVAPHVSSGLATHSLTTPPAQAEESQELIVFTAWRQIETANPTSRTTIADYDTQPASDAHSTPAATTPEKNPAQAAGDKSGPCAFQRRTTVTQLILRIVPAGSKSTHPAAVPLGDGWFAIQL